MATDVMRSEIELPAPEPHIGRSIPLRGLIRHVLLFVGVIFSAILVWEQFWHGQDSTLTELVGVAILFLVAGALNLAPLALRIFPKPAEESRSEDVTAHFEEAKPQQEQAMPREGGIYIAPHGIAVELMTDIAKVRLEIFSFSQVELRYLRVACHAANAGDFAIESAEPQRIEKMLAHSIALEKALTAHHAAAIRKASIISIHGTAKFEDDIEVSFSFAAPPYK
jgi:hypothetical protein